MHAQSCLYASTATAPLAAGGDIEHAGVDFLSVRPTQKISDQTGERAAVDCTAFGFICSSYRGDSLVLRYKMGLGPMEQ
jgi:hypothetical protein